MTTNRRLSSRTARRIDWQKIGDAIRVSLDYIGRSRSSPGATTVAAPAFDKELIREAFASVQREFQRVLAPLRVQMKVASGLILVSLAATIAGAALATVNPWRGGVLSAAGIVSMFTVLTRAWQLAKDQAMLELIPARYELALQFAASTEQFEAILNEFMRETSSLRR